MAYSKRNWPSGTTPISEDNLEAMDEGIYQNSKEIESLKAPESSGYVPSTRKITNLSLDKDITVPDLQDALTTYPVLTGAKAPTISTVGKRRQLYAALSEKALYICISASATAGYKWEWIVSYKGSSLTDEQIATALEAYLKENPIEGTGADGKSAYQVALDNGFEGTEEEWLDSLKGADGENGISPTITTTQTTDGVLLAIQNGDNGGIKAVKILNGEDGPQGPQGEQGENGANGQDGYTPVKGTDYWTDEDKAEIITEVKADLSQIAPPTIVNSVDEMTDTSKHYVLNGSIYAYMSGESGLVADFTNLADTTLSTDTTLTPTSTGWLENVRINSSGAIATANGCDITNFISVGNATVLRCKNINFTHGYSKISYYLNGSFLYGMTTNTEGVKAYFVEVNEEYAEITIAKLLEILQLNKGANATFDSIRIGGMLTGTKEDVIITLDEEITYTEATGYEWTNTGLQYTATLYTDLIGIVDENNVIRLSANNLPSGTYTLKYGDESFETIGTITID